MPNWCDNKLRVSGPIEDVVNFKRHAVGHPVIWPRPSYEKQEDYDKRVEETQKMKVLLTFSKFVPVPEDVLKKEYSMEGYNWCVNNWGTKWDLGDEGMTVEEDGKVLIYRFTTAWSPPIPVVIAMSEQFPRLRFSIRFREDGMGFKGIESYKGGMRI